MTIGTALVIIAILYLVDKHNLWKRVAVVLLAALVVALVCFGGYYGWEKLQEFHRLRETRGDKTANPSLPTNSYALSEVEEAPSYSADEVEEAPAGLVPKAPNTGRHDEIDLSAGLVPKWNIPSPPKGFISEDVAIAILDPVKVDEKAKTDAWLWYRDSKCVIAGDPQQAVNRILHERDLFSFESYDPRWLKGISLGEEVKRALWNARVKECQLPPESKNVRACLDRTTGTIDTDPKWAKYMESCGSAREMIYLNSAN
jgi:hypothetical protein